MYFLPRNNLFYSFIVHVRPAYRYAGVLLALSVVAYSWFAVVYVPAQKIIAWHQQEITRLTGQHDELEQAQKTTNQLEQSVHELRSKLRSSSQGKSIEHLQQDAMTKAVSLATESGLSLVSCTADTSVDKDWYVKNKLTVALTGELGACASFLAHLKQVQSTRVKSLQLTQAEQARYNLTCVLSVMAPK